MTMPKKYLALLIAFLSFNLPTQAGEGTWAAVFLCKNLKEAGVFRYINYHSKKDVQLFKKDCEILKASFGERSKALAHKDVPKFLVKFFRRFNALKYTYWLKNPHILKTEALYYPGHPNPIILVRTAGDPHQFKSIAYAARYFFDYVKYFSPFLPARLTPYKPIAFRRFETMLTSFKKAERKSRIHPASPHETRGLSRPSHSPLVTKDDLQQSFYEATGITLTPTTLTLLLTAPDFKIEFMGVIEKAVRAVNEKLARRFLRNMKGFRPDQRYAYAARNALIKAGYATPGLPTIHEGGEEEGAAGTASLKDVRPTIEMPEEAGGGEAGGGSDSSSPVSAPEAAPSVGAATPLTQSMHAADAASNAAAAPAARYPAKMRGKSHKSIHARTATRLSAVI